MRAGVHAAVEREFRRCSGRPGRRRQRGGLGLRQGSGAGGGGRVGPWAAPCKVPPGPQDPSRPSGWRGAAGLAGSMVGLGFVPGGRWCGFLPQARALGVCGAAVGAAGATGKGHSGSPEGLAPPATHLKLMSQQWECFLQENSQHLLQTGSQAARLQPTARREDPSDRGGEEAPGPSRTPWLLKPRVSHKSRARRMREQRTN